jgi:hypothetical protein
MRSRLRRGTAWCGSTRRRRDRASVEKLLWLNPDGIVLEPSGYWYSAFWASVATQYNRLVAKFVRQKKI